MIPALSQEFYVFCEQEQLQKHANLDKNPYCVYGTLKLCNVMFGVLGPRCWTWPSMLDCHVLKGFDTYMIGVLGRLY